MTSDRKLISIRTILRNEAFTRESGLYQRLKEKLNKLSADDLSDLATVVEQSRLEVSQAVREEQAKVS
jgi:hypothetical protein